MSLDLNELPPFGRDIGFGYLDRSLKSPRQYHPHLVLNTASDSMLRALRSELRSASSFAFSVAFVSPRAIALLKQELVDFEGVGRIVTSNYLGFNSPAAFAELLNLTQHGIDIRLHPDPAFHPKGYIFTSPDSVTAILGSSNLTEGAITRNHEWNLRVSATRNSDLAAQFTNLLDEELFRSTPLTQEWIDAYASTYSPPSRTSAPGTIIVGEPSPTPEISPNSMQVEALDAIAKVRAEGKDRALVISATGTGKTILSALDVRAVRPDRLLFVAHREQILDRAMREFRRVLGGAEADFGKLAGTSRQADRRYVFATVQTLSRPEVLESINPTEFDYVLIDEVHRAGAASFDRVLQKLHPKFMLGMTATPERSDGANIFELFDYNVPYEIRLNRALELEMLSPFHYYGVADITFEDGMTTTVLTPLYRLLAPERVDYLIHALETYGQAGIPARGLIFCSRKEEAHGLSAELNKRTLRGAKLRTIALTGEDSIEAREHVVDRLEAGELDYVLTVDIFNEGVDIPSVNQVVMLRQTQSAIVFVQQLGRGLRNAEGKDYLVVIDFIGNYNNNYLIPIALFGDDSLNKESLRKNLIAAEEVGVVAGLSSIRFDRIAHKRILDSLATAELDSFHNLKAAIESVRSRVGRVPALGDFLRFESVDPIVLATRLDSYPLLLEKLLHVQHDLSPQELRFLAFLSKEVLTSRRSHEMALLKHLTGRETTTRADIELLFADHQLLAPSNAVDSAIATLTLDFNTSTELVKYAHQAVLVDDGNHVSLSPGFSGAYRSGSRFKDHVDDLLETGLAIASARYDPARPFTAGRQYSRKDACRLLGWLKNMSGAVFGYKVDEPTGTCAIFVTLHKGDDVSASTDYEDVLLNTRTMRWYTKSKRNLSSNDVRPIVANSVELHVFANRAKGEDFFYLGRATSSDAELTTMKDSALSVVKMLLTFDQPVDAALFDYFHTGLAG